MLASGLDGGSPTFKQEIDKFRRPADLVFDPTPAFTRFAEDLLLRYAMIAGCIRQGRLTWVLLPVPGLDFQPQTRAALLILSSGG